MATNQSAGRLSWAVMASILFHVGVVIAIISMKIAHDAPNAIEMVEVTDQAAPPVEIPVEPVTTPVADHAEDSTPAPEAPRVSAPAPVVAAAPARSIAPSVAAAPKVAAAPVAAPDFDSAVDDAAVVAPVSVHEDDFEEDVEAADRGLKAQAAIVPTPSIQTEDAEKESEALAAEARKNEEARQKEAARLAAERREQERLALAEKSAQAALAAAAAEAAALEQSKKESVVAEPTGEATVMASAPSSEGVRSVESLRPLPGNQRPQYNAEDRRAGRQGDVIYQAYISPEGVPTEIKMVQSSGHRSLDLQTLKSIKSWKFYPGQEGWVEIPVHWELKGGPQESGGTLRKKICQQ